MYLRLTIFLLYSFIKGIILTSENEEITLYPKTILQILQDYSSAVQRLTKNAKTKECKSKITDAFNKYNRALSYETAYPFEDIMFFSECSTMKPYPLLPLKTKKYPEKPYLAPSPVRPGISLLADRLAILYILLVHDQPEMLARIIQSLYEKQHTFVIHVDKKAPEVFKLAEYLTKVYDNVFVVREGRQSANWGGFTIVNATLISMRLGWTLSRHFDFVINLSGTSYPIKSNDYIRSTLAESADRVYMEIRPEPNMPPPEMWQYYVECDDAIHRVARLTLARGMGMYAGSQWWIMPRHVSQWFLESELVRNYTEYAEHIVVADENFFATLLKNSPYCADHVNFNYNFLQFDKWEHDREFRNWRKCLQPDTDQCGRSPSTLTAEYLPLVEASNAFFARKFDSGDESSMLLLDRIDAMRAAESTDLFSSRKSGQLVMLRQQIAILNTSYGKREEVVVTVCLEMPEKMGRIRAVPCNPASTLQWFTLGPCTGGSNAVSVYDGQCRPPVGVNKSLATEPEARTPFCQIRGAGGAFCVDISGENPRVGGGIINWDCTGRWNQLFHLDQHCQIAAVMPEAVGKTKGPLFEGRDVRLCWQSHLMPNVPSPIFDLVTADCADNNKQTKLPIPGREQPVGMNNGTVISIAIPRIMHFTPLRWDGKEFHKLLSEEGKALVAAGGDPRPKELLSKLR